MEDVQHDAAAVRDPLRLARAQRRKSFQPLKQANGSLAARVRRIAADDLVVPFQHQHAGTCQCGFALPEAEERFQVGSAGRYQLPSKTCGAQPQHAGGSRDDRPAIAVVTA